MIRLAASWGLFRRKETWVLTWRGWLVLLFLSGAAFALVIHSVYPFLAITRPVSRGILVVEGWLSDAALESAVRTFTAHDYRLLVTTGGPMSKGGHLSQYHTYAELAAATVRKLGISQNLVVAVPAPPVRTDRTFESALAFRNWLSRSDLELASLDVYSSGAHARRTWLSYQEALGNTIVVGIIAAAPKYDVDRWWASSEGTKAVVTELIAYLHVRFFPSSMDSGASDGASAAMR